MLKQFFHKTRTFEDITPIFSVEDNQLIFKDGRVAVGYRVFGVEMEKLSTGEYHRLSEAFGQALKNLELDGCVQLLNFYYYQDFQMSIKDKSYFEERTIYHFSDRPIQQHQQFLFVSFGKDDSKEKLVVNNLYVRGTKYLKNPFKNLLEVKEKVENMASSFVSMISHTDIVLERLDENALKQVALSYFNLEFGYEQRGVSQTYAPEKNGLVVGNKKVGIVSLSGQPSTIFSDTINTWGVAAPFIYPLTNYLSIPHILSISFKSVDTPTAINALERQGRIANNLGFMSSQIHETKSQDTINFIDEISGNGYNLLDLNVLCMVFGLSDKERNRHLEMVEKAFRDMGADAYRESFDTTNLFFSNVPGNSFQNFRWRESISHANAALYSTFITNYQTAEKGELVCDRFGQPLLLDLYNPEKFANQNFMVIGPTGSGKTFTVSSFILQRHQRKEKQVIIDVGGSYKTLFFALENSKYFDYDPEKPLRYNPFLVQRNSKTGKYLLTGDKSEFIINLISTIWKGSEPLKNAERSLLNDLLPHYFDFFNENGSKKVPSLAGFYEFLRRETYQKYLESDELAAIKDNFNFSELLMTLKPFATGIYANVLNTEAYDDISAYDLICFDLTKVKDNPTLYPVVGMLIAELAFDIIDKFPKVIKRLYIDEAWSMLKGVIGDFIEYMYRTIRKVEGCIGIITQGINEIETSGIGKTVKNNSAMILLLRHTDTSVIEEVSRYLGFNAQEEELFKSLRKDEHDNFREFFLKRSETAQVFRLEVPPEVMAVLTSRAEDRNRIREMSGRNGEYLMYAIRRQVEFQIKRGRLKTHQLTA